MYVCVCKAVSDRQIQRAVREDGVVSLRELTRDYGLGTCCGKCVPQAREVLTEALLATHGEQLPMVARNRLPVRATA
jgi:bacterioferritin-associated ferredoxin